MSLRYLNLGFIWKWKWVWNRIRDFVVLTILIIYISIIILWIMDCCSPCSSSKANLRVISIISSLRYQNSYAIMNKQIFKWNKTLEPKISNIHIHINVYTHCWNFERRVVYTRTHVCIHMYVCIYVCRHDMFYNISTHIILFTIQTYVFV